MQETYFAFENINNFLLSSDSFDFSGNTAKLKNTGTEMLPEYSKENPYITLACDITAAKLLSFTSDENVTGNDNLRYTMIIDGKEKYFSGGLLVDSCGYVNSNTVTEINASALDALTGLSNFNIRIYFHSEDGTTTPIVSSFSLALTNISTDGENPNSFIDYEEGEKLINANVINGEAFKTLSWSDKEKYLIKAYNDITSLPYFFSLSHFSVLPTDIQQKFKLAQSFQAFSLFMPDTYSRFIRDNGIYDYSLDGEKISADVGMKYRLCAEARELLEEYIDLSIGVY